MGGVEEFEDMSWGGDESLGLTLVSMLHVDCC